MSGWANVSNLPLAPAKSVFECYIPVALLDSAALSQAADEASEASWCAV